MTAIIADYIISPLGSGTSANLKAVQDGHSALRLYVSPPLEPYCASLLPDMPLIDGLSRFETLCVDVIRKAAGETYASLLTDKRTVLILSTTKGNVARLASGGDPLLTSSAQKIAGQCGMHNRPIVVSNACISGVCALITAKRLLDAGVYRHAVVVGCDVLSPFILSGFQSFKALSSEPCRPFDKDRTGLNLGEAAACMLLTADSQAAADAYGTIASGAIHNDANHISGPSRTGEGSLRCLRDVAGRKEDLAFVNVHGTATAYNDEMESIALTRAGLQDVPVNGLKGFFGHTLGTAGLLETIFSLHALRQGIILPTRGFSQQGTSCPVQVSAAVRHTDKREFIKLLSGFGGCNAAVRICTGTPATATSDCATAKRELHRKAEIHITPHAIRLNGAPLPVTQQGEALLTELYRTYVKDYPKFFKMDTLSRLGFIASEILLGSTGEERFVPREDRAVVLANRSASLKNDTDYQATIAPDNYYPSPALFVYTLPNIVTGEIAIRNKYYGESSFYVLDDQADLLQMAQTAMQQPSVGSVLTGWVECSTKDNWEAHMVLLTE